MNSASYIFADEMSNMSNSMSKMKDDLNQRMDAIANDIEKKLASKISNIVNKRVNVETTKLSKAVNKRIDDIRDDMNADIESLQQRIDEMLGSSSEKVELNEKHLNICIRNHPQREREMWLTSCQICLQLDSHYMTLISKRRFEKGETIENHVFVTCKSKEDKIEIIRRKKQLRKNRRYERVYIHTDQSLEICVNNNNMKHCYRLLVLQV